MMRVGSFMVQLARRELQVVKADACWVLMMYFVPLVGVIGAPVGYYVR